MADMAINLLRMDDPTLAEALLDSLRQEGLDGTVSSGEEEGGGAVILFWRPNI